MSAEYGDIALISLFPEFGSAAGGGLGASRELLHYEGIQVGGMNCSRLGGTAPKAASSLPFLPRSPLQRC